MDTRLKIVSPELARRDISKVVIGYFDPLFVDHVTRLAEISDGDRITAVVVGRKDELLPARARAEVVAALSCVEQVILCDDKSISEFGAAQIFDEREADQKRTRELSAHIVERYRPE